jgi:hypothetical protein
MRRLVWSVAFAALFGGGAALTGGSAASSPAPADGRDPARARVAAQCAAFWDGAGRPARAAPFRALARRHAARPSEADRAIDALRPEMAALAEAAARSPRAAELFSRHARLCAIGAADEPETDAPAKSAPASP